MKRILIIGISSYTGYYLANLAKKDYDIFGTYNYRPITIPNCTIEYLEKSQDNMSNGIVSRTKPDIIIDCAALHNADFCENNSKIAHSVNVTGSANVARAARRVSAKLVFISTDYVFDGTKGNYKETDPVNPINVYGKTKADAESIIRRTTQNHIIARTSDIYGWCPLHLKDRASSSKKSSTFAEWVIKNLSEKKRINLFIDQYNNSTYANNLAEMILELIKLNLTGTFHTAGLTCQNRYSQGVTICDRLHISRRFIRPIKSDTLNQVAKRPKKLCLNLDKIKKELETRPLSIQQGISEMLKNKWC